MRTTSEALSDLLARAPRDPIEADPEWPSECVPEGADGMVAWSPVRQREPWDISAIEEALGEPLHPSIRDLFGTYWAATLEHSLDEDPVLLPLAWNEEELASLTASLATEAQTKSALGQQVTLFIANTEDDRVWAVDNRDGSVWLEEVGHAPERCVASSVREFLDRLS